MRRIDVLVAMTCKIRDGAGDTVAVLAGLQLDHENLIAQPTRFDAGFWGGVARSQSTEKHCVLTLTRLPTVREPMRRGTLPFKCQSFVAAVPTTKLHPSAER